MSNTNLDFRRTYFNQGKAIYIFNEIENYINFIITHKVEPADKDFFIDYFLNTSIISFGAKIKLLINLNIFDKTDIEIVRKYLNYRNTFAHTNRDLQLYFDFSKTRLENDSIVGTALKFDNTILRTNSNGKLSKEDYSKFIEDFNITQAKIVMIIKDYILTNSIPTGKFHVVDLENRCNDQF